MSTYRGDTGANSHESWANYPSSKRLKTPAHRTPARTKTNELEETCSKAHLAYKKMCANIALDYYNDQNDTRFELLEDETLDNYSFADFFGSWIHCSFNAKEDSSINKFFAELQYVYPLGPAVTTCEILVQATTLEYSDKALSKANHKHNETRANIALDYYNNKNDARFELAPYNTVTIDHFVPKIPTYTPRLPTPYREGMFTDHALDHYNKTNGTKFAYVEDSSTRWTSFNMSWIHICFNASDASASDASAVKLFFAEIKYYASKPTVTVCKILEGETKGGCELCLHRFLTHPVVGYHVDLVTTEN